MTEDSELGCQHMVTHIQTTGKDIKKGPKQPAQKTAPSIISSLWFIYWFVPSITPSGVTGVGQGSQQVQPLP